MLSRPVEGLRALRADIRVLGTRGALSLAARRVHRRPPSVFRELGPLLTGRRGLEIGGPSPIFARGGLLPVYPLLGALDNCTFGRETIWEGAVVEGETFRYDPGRPAGRQYLLDATDLRQIGDGAYEAVLSSHVLEHVANPMRALAEWCRVLAPGGVLLLVVPHRENTFDHRRPVTSLGHLRDDLARGVGEDDATHLEEWLALADLGRMPGLAREEFVERSLAFPSNRAIHHHVFDTALVGSVVDAAGFRLHALATALPFHVVALAAKPASGARPDNSAFLAFGGPHLRASVFRSDHEPLATAQKASACA